MQIGPAIRSEFARPVPAESHVLARGARAGSVLVKGPSFSLPSNVAVADSWLVRDASHLCGMRQCGEML